jgi:hypothetical protein
MDDISLDDLYRQGETLIIEHTGFHHDGELWIRDELHRIVGHPCERHSLYCAGPNDHSGMQGPPGDDARDCALCDQCRVHTRALHQLGGTAELTLDF